MTSKIIKEYTEPLTTPINADRSIFTILEAVSYTHLTLPTNLWV